VFYVYTLSSPDGAVFYVGKGKGRRIDAHERQARLGVDSPKCAAIRKIWASGGRVLKEKVAFFNSEQDAYAEEKRLIESLPGLTNGGRVAAKPFDPLIRVLAYALRAKHGAMKEPSGEFGKAVYRSLICKLPGFEARAASKYPFDELARKIAEFGVILQPIGNND
jgi:hypothetical protein